MCGNVTAGQWLILGNFFAAENLQPWTKYLGQSYVSAVLQFYQFFSFSHFNPQVTPKTMLVGIL